MEERNPVFEGELINWALQRNYLVCDRIWRDQRVKERRLEKEFEGDELKFVSWIKDLGAGSIDFQRVIYFPCGYLGFSMNHPNADGFNINSELSLRGFLEKEKLYNVFIRFKMGGWLAST